MGAATIPPPNQDQVDTARFSLRLSAEHCGLDLEDPAVQQFIELQVQVSAQKMAEICWLDGLTQDPVALAEFLEQRKSSEAN